MINAEKINSLSDEELRIVCYGLSVDNVVDYTEDSNYLRLIRPEILPPLINKISTIIKDQHKETFESAFKKLLG